jgi:hypothetical protein
MTAAGKLCIEQSSCSHRQRKQKSRTRQRALDAASRRIARTRSGALACLHRVATACVHIHLSAACVRLKMLHSSRSKLLTLHTHTHTQVSHHGLTDAEFTRCLEMGMDIDEFVRSKKSRAERTSGRKKAEDEAEGAGSSRKRRSRSSSRRIGDDDADEDDDEDEQDGDNDGTEGSSRSRSKRQR